MLGPSERLALLMSALLHDLGHATHTRTHLKHIFNTDHERIPNKLFCRETEINQVLRQVAPDFPG